MAPKRPLRCSQIVLLSCVLSVGAHASAAGQGPLVARGATVRVSRPDSAGRPIWSTGRIVYVASDRLMLAETDHDPLVRLNEAVRLQVRRSHSKSALGGSLGLGIGAIVGWQAGHSAGGSSNTLTESIAGALVGGIVGASLGTILGNLIRSTSWEDVALEGGQLSPESLQEADTGPDVPLIGTYRWNRFQPTVANFEAFFRQQAQSLDSIEGIWAREAGRPAVAIVRTSSESEEKYTAFEIVLPQGRAARRDDGLLLFALELNPDGDRWSVRYPGGIARSFRASVEDGLLGLEYDAGLWDYWEKLFPD